MMRETSTNVFTKSVDTAYDVSAILQVCRAALEAAESNMNSAPVALVMGAVRRTLSLADNMNDEMMVALELAERTVEKAGA
jgi:hypothetical protein